MPICEDITKLCIILMEHIERELLEYTMWSVAQQWVYDDITCRATILIQSPAYYIYIVNYNTRCHIWSACYIQLTTSLTAIYGLQPPSCVFAILSTSRPEIPKSHNLISPFLFKRILDGFTSMGMDNDAMDDNKHQKYLCG